MKGRRQGGKHLVLLPEVSCHRGTSRNPEESLLQLIRVLSTATSSSYFVFIQLCFYSLWSSSSDYLIHFNKLFFWVSTALCHRNCLEPEMELIRENGLVMVTDDKIDDRTVNVLLL